MVYLPKEKARLAAGRVCQFWLSLGVAVTGRTAGGAPE